MDVRWTPLSIKLGLNAVTSGVLFQIKKKTKKRYKYEVYRLRWQHECIIRERLGIALSQSSHRDFWKEVCNITLSSKGRGSSAPIVDGCSSNSDTSPAFSPKFCDLLNSNTSLENPLSCDELPLTSVSADTISEALLRRMLLAAFGITTLLVLMHDVVLLAPSPSALCHMVDTCSHFASSHSLVFNSTKHSLLDLLGVVLVIKATFSFLGRELELAL